VNTINPEKNPNPNPNLKKITVTNIGQILLICFLFIIILMQTVSIIPKLYNSVSGDNNILTEENENINLPANIINTKTEENENINLPANIINTKTEENKNENNIKNTENTNNMESDILETILILGENNGKLAVLSPDGQTVYETFDVYINTLPDYDKNLLQNGIKIKTAEELYSLLEDYNS